MFFPNKSIYLSCGRQIILLFWPPPYNPSSGRQITRLFWRLPYNSSLLAAVRLRQINYIKLYFICVTYGLPYFSFRFVSLRFFLFFFFLLFRFFSHYFVFVFLRFVFFFVSFRCFSPCFLFVFFLSVSFRFFPFLSLQVPSKKTSKTRQKFDFGMEPKITTLLPTCF